MLSQSLSGLFWLMVYVPTRSTPLDTLTVNCVLSGAVYSTLLFRFEDDSSQYKYNDFCNWKGVRVAVSVAETVCVLYLPLAFAVFVNCLDEKEGE